MRRKSHRQPPPDAESTFDDPRALAAFLADLLAQPGVPGADLTLLGAGRRLRLRLRLRPPQRPPGAPELTPPLTIVPLGESALAALLARRARAAGSPALASPAGANAARRELADLLLEAQALEADLRRLLAGLAAGPAGDSGERGWLDPDLDRLLRLRSGLEGLLGE